MKFEENLKAQKVKVETKFNSLDKPMHDEKALKLIPQEASCQRHINNNKDPRFQFHAKNQNV